MNSFGFLDSCPAVYPVTQRTGAAFEDCSYPVKARELTAELLL